MRRHVWSSDVVCDGAATGGGRCSWGRSASDAAGGCEGWRDRHTSEVGRGRAQKEPAARLGVAISPVLRLTF